MKKHQQPRGLTVAAFARAKKLDPACLGKFGVSDSAFGGREAVRFPYGDTDGVECAVRFRLSMKEKKCFRWEKGTKPCLYGLWRLKRMRRAGYVIIVEGESDTLTLWSRKLPALGLPGAASWQEEWAKYLRRFQKIFVIIEPDRGGETVLRWVSASSIRGRVYLVRLDGAKDPSELHLKDPAGFGEAFQKALDQAEPWSEEDQPKSGKSDSTKDRSQATRLANLVNVKDLFHADDKPYATVTVGGHRENWAVNSKRFKQWLTRSYYEAEQKIPNTQAISEALNVIGGKALFDGREASIFTRVAELDGKIYVDLADAKWRAIEISADGWRLVTEPPVRFRRTNGMLALPEPVLGGDVNELASFINFGSNNDKLLAASWLVTALRPRGPYPILALHGEQGSAKSTAARVFRSLIDPSTASLRSAPRDVRDLMIGATNSHVISLDNISHLEPWLADALCRLSTGGGLSTRQLYTDDEETVFNAMRPVLLNGIGEVTARGDLMERTVLLYLPAIEEDCRESEEEFWRRFEKAQSRILGGLFTAVSAALREYPSVKLDKLPRMADFAKWATAAETTLGAKSGAFMKAYARNRRNANDVVLESSPLAAFVMRLAARNGDWKGTASELLADLTSSGGADRSHIALPKSANGLSAALRRLAPNLRTIGIGVYFDRESGTGQRTVIINAIE